MPWSVGVQNSKEGEITYSGQLVASDNDEYEIMITRSKHGTSSSTRFDTALFKSAEYRTLVLLGKTSARIAGRRCFNSCS